MVFSLIPVYAASPEGNTEHTITENISAPPDTKINMFDYWTVGEQDDSDNNVQIDDMHEVVGGGINQNHLLLFGNGDGAYSGIGESDWCKSTVGEWNCYTGDVPEKPVLLDGPGNPYRGIVSEELGTDGYPKLDLKDGHIVGSHDISVPEVYFDETARIKTDESLAYLFDPNETNQPGKAVYENASGLLRKNDNGYYYFNSDNDNNGNNCFAELNTDNGENKFVLYETPWLYKDKPQFFPFGNHTDFVNGQDCDVTGAEVNHYFGMTMEYEFTQPKGGIVKTDTLGDKDMTFEISGDDDIWVFIDNKLAIDMGGIHQSCKAEINFKDGIINYYNVNGFKFRAVYLSYAMGERNGALDSEKWKTLQEVTYNGNKFSVGTFADNTIHTMKVFYLERGNNDSDFGIKFNTTKSEFKEDSNLPADEVWSASDADMADTMHADATAYEGVAFGPIRGLSGYGGFVNGGGSLSIEHNGKTYSLTKSWKAGSGNTTKRCLYFTPKQACIVTVAYTATQGRTVSIQQNGVTLASGDSGKVGNSPATIEADIEDPNAGDVYIINGSSNKEIYAIFADYYDPNVIVNQPVSGNIEYSGSNDTSNLKIRFTSKNEKDETPYYEVPFGTSYSTELRQQRDYDISVVDADGNKSDKVAVTLGTSTLSVKKQPVTANLKVVDIVETPVSGDVVVHDVNNDSESLNLSGVTLTFTSKENPEQYTYTAAIDAAQKKLNVTLMPGETYDITATGADGYTLSELSKTYVMAAGDEAPFKNVLFTEEVSAGSVPFAAEVHVGANKEYKTMTDAMTAIKAMAERPAGESGRVTVLVDPGTYTEQLQVDANYVTIKAANEAERPELQWYYGIGYLYYSAGDNQYYSEDYAVQKTRKSSVTRWGAACRVSGTNVNIENIIFRNTFNCFVSEAELADGVDAANNNEYSDVNNKPERTTANYDAKSTSAVERAAAIALDGTNTELYKCDFISSQDTFYTNKNAYVKECYIEGGTDFIFGGNSILFEDCTLAWHGYSDTAKGGYLTACQTSDVPVAGTANMSTNGYMFKNTKLTNSTYYPDNKFAQGGWGRNWGGAKCQVVFNGVTLGETGKFAGVSGWTKMGGELSGSVLFVTDVKNADGTAVDSSSTAFNPNGTMESKNYTMLKDSDYLGGWNPPHYEGSEEITEYTTTWRFGEGSGAQSYAIEGGDNPSVEIVGDTNAPTEQKLTVDTSAGGKFNNSGRGDEWAQVNDGTKFTIPVVNGSKIRFGANNANGTLSIGNKSFTSSEEFTYNGLESTVEATATGVGYMSYIQVVSPKNPSTDVEEIKEYTINGTIANLDEADKSTVKLIGKLGASYKALDVTDGTFSIVLEEGDEFSIKGVYGGASAYTVPDGTKLVTSETTPTITATKVTATATTGTREYKLGDDSVIPAISVNFTNFITSDGLLKFGNMKYHNDHGVCNAQTGALTVTIPVAGNSTISFLGCQFAGDTTQITAPENVTPASANLKTTACNTAIDFTYTGEATELTFSIDGGAIYLHGIKVVTE